LVAVLYLQGDTILGLPRPLNLVSSSAVCASVIEKGRLLVALLTLAQMQLMLMTSAIVVAGLDLIKIETMQNGMLVSTV
jgi:hypothetical protein